jgi:nucleoside-diphosphate-sugar epimerase
MFASKPDILLLGGGYTLSKLAESLGAERLLLTHRSAAKVVADQARGFQAETLDVLHPKALEQLLDRYPSIRFIVDSVPPVVSEPTVGPSNIVKSIQGRSIAGLIYLSSTGVYGRSSGELVNEQTIPQPSNWRGQNRVVCEEVYQALNMPVAILRLSGIYGSDRGLIQSLRAGRYQLKSGRWSNRIHVDDIVQTIEWLLLKCAPTEWPRVMNVSDDEPALIEDVVQFYCSKLGIRFPELLEGEPPSDSFYGSNQQVDNTLLKTVSVLQLKYPNYRTMVYPL